MSSRSPVRAGRPQPRADSVDGPSVGAVVTNFNGGECVIRTLAALSRQKYALSDIVVVDNESTASSRAILSGSGPQVEVVVGVVAHPQRPDPGRQLVDEGRVDVLVHVDALDPAAGLAAVLQPAPDCASGGPLEVGVRADQHGVVATQLQ